MSSALRLTRMCECLAMDVVPLPTSISKKALPAINGQLALSFAQALDRLLEGQVPLESAPGKPHYLLYHHLLLHSTRHILHKYKRKGETSRYQYKCWGIHDFEANEGKWFTYMEYPLTEDLFALKREVIVRTKIGKLVDEKLDGALDNITDGAMKPASILSFKDFQDDFSVSLPLLERLVAFVQTQGKENS